MIKFSLKLENAINEELLILQPFCANIDSLDEIFSCDSTQDLSQITFCNAKYNHDDEDEDLDDEDEDYEDDEDYDDEEDEDFDDEDFDDDDEDFDDEDEDYEEEEDKYENATSSIYRIAA